MSLAILSIVSEAGAQRFLTDMMDTTTGIGKGIYPIYQKYDRLKFGGYMHPQFQWIETKGAKTYNAGDFPKNTDNRFRLRRGRIRVDYAHYNEQNQPLAYFAFQFDGTEQGVNIRDFWGRFYENKLGLFAVTTGMFARPMGFEVNLSSSDRETPERGRMSQILMKTERDLGMMLTIEPRKAHYKFKWLRLDVGVFNGQGLAGPGEYDSHKDLIGRLYLKPRKIKNLGWTVSAGLSGYYGGIVSQSPWIFKTTGTGNDAVVKGDSTPSNINYISPRQYAGADVQLKIPNAKGFSEFRAETIMGTQTGTANSSETPGTYPVSSTTNLPQPLYTRTFNGAYFYYLQHLGREDLQFIAKYDWYDPNTAVSGKQVDAAKGFSPADIKYSTLSAGFLYYINVHVKLFLYYDWVTNENTSIPGYTGDIKDNVITCRLQFRF